VKCLISEITHRSKHAEETPYSESAKLNGRNFKFSQGTESGDKDNRLYGYKFESNTLVIREVNLLYGSIGAVFSTKTFQKEVFESLKDVDCFCARFAYVALQQNRTSTQFYYSGFKVGLERFNIIATFDSLKVDAHHRINYCHLITFFNLN
jgi:hypothetical protein